MVTGAGAAFAVEVTVIVVGEMDFVSVTVTVTVEAPYWARGAVYWPEEPVAICSGRQAWVTVTVDEAAAIMTNSPSRTIEMDFIVMLRKSKESNVKNQRESVWEA